MSSLEEILTQNILENNDCVRLFHGRGKLIAGLEHVVIDYFVSNILITLFKEFEQSEENDLICNIILLLKKNSSLVIENIFVQKRYLPRPQLVVIEGVIPENAIAQECGLKFNLKFGESQNIGFFLDMYPGRRLLESISRNKKVLNLFSYTCSLSVAALKGGASSVVNIDMSKAALAVGESNHLLNDFNLREARFYSYDIMKSWNKIYKYGPYDIVVIDPPSNQGDSFVVERDYYKIIKRLNEMTESQADVMACLNSPYLNAQYLIDLFKEHAPNYEFQKIIYSAFSQMEKNPEEGLKIVMFKRVN
jgi:23S rRNA (cytosine1962-C5)-methyltransferase